MKSSAHAEHRAVHSHHHQFGRHAAVPPGELKRLAFWASLFGYASTMVLLLRIAMARRSAAWVALAADAASIAIMDGGVELHPVAHRARANQHQHAIEVSEIKEIALDLPNVGSLIVGELGPEQLRLNKTKSTPVA